ncbi:ABC transporter substrate-binding protein [Microseira wollei]|uniref:Receptor ligand binding region domain-containing protein n=1 Tax=Microseira wollei NIES-4236 TaxID=2530354 RepID=A0AAV3XNT6_9CYAN|nr:ABC transporter substrate-binding protein [Microseira wollei]GET43998.1 hypothetical protein MiSe_88240 [Microseira wollei NIES-4236]
MIFNVVPDFLFFIIEVVLLNIALNLLANSIHIPPTPRNRIILAVIALFLALILFWIKNIVYPPPICQPSPDVATRLSTGGNNLITKNTPYEKDREQKIYDNNRQVDANNSYLLAVAVPGNARQQAARAMLAGVADAQTKFNQAQKDPTTPKKSSQPKLLNIVVVDDNDDKDVASKVACQIATNPEWKNILGVIGHHSSNASKAALEIYAKAGITMITPTSTSTNLRQDSNNKVFFRATVSNAALGRSLADEIGTLGKVRIFYEGNNEYSKELKNKFK